MQKYRQDRMVLGHRRYIGLGDDASLPNVIGMSITDLQALVATLGEERYRAQQIMDWVYGKAVYSFQAMANLPASLRERLGQCSRITLPAVITVQVASDGTRKYLLRLADAECVEAVTIPEGDRITACLSSQVGCAMGCAFCATGLSGLARNLQADEMVGQLLALQQHLGTKVTNVVMMGMGEPLANYGHVIEALVLMNHPQALGIGARRFTISTCGVVPGIRRLSAEKLQVNLAVSLHAPNDRLRDELVPINRRYPIPRLLAACAEYAERTGRRVSFEYALLRDVNDSAEQAHQLGELLRGRLCHLNLIPANEVPGTGYHRPTEKAIAGFARIVRSYGITATVRKERGSGIDAACGQLRRSEVKAF